MKTIVRALPLPDGVLVSRFRLRGNYVDCFGVDVPGAPTMPAFVESFFSAPAFGFERFVLTLTSRLQGMAGRRSSDSDKAGDRGEASLSVFDIRPRPDDLSALASGAGARYAAWTVEARAANEILLCDVLAFTRCWLMVAPSPDRSDATRLYFGTAFVKSETRNVLNFLLRALFATLRPFHGLYARALLASAARHVRVAAERGR